MKNYHKSGEIQENCGSLVESYDKSESPGIIGRVG